MDIKQNILNEQEKEMSKQIFIDTTLERISYLFTNSRNSIILS